MGAITQARSDLTKILLVACDQSYWGGPESNTQDPRGSITGGTPLAPYLDSTGPGGDASQNTMPSEWNNLGLSSWVVFKRYDESATGFGATLYRKENADGSADYIVAMQGTRGLNIQDWGGNLIYGWDKWGGPAAQKARDLQNDLLNNLGTVGTIHFTGQSLGGALAQYALYDYARQIADFSPSKVTLTTFNGLGAIDGLNQNAPGFKTSRVSTVDTAHFWIRNDIVSRLGGGHLNGTGNEYVLDFWQTND